jgi:MFS family permease
MTEKVKQSFRAPSKGLALALLATTQFVLILDIAIVTVALPSIGADLEFASADLSWVINAYALTFGGFLLLGGRMSDLIGRRRMFMAGLIIFTVASPVRSRRPRSGSSSPAERRVSERRWSHRPRCRS